MSNEFGKYVKFGLSVGITVVLVEAALKGIENALGEGEAAKRKLLEHIQVVNCLDGAYVSAWFRINAKAGENGVVQYLTDEHLRVIRKVSGEQVDREHYLLLALYEKKDGTVRLREYLIVNFVRMEKTLQTMLNENDGVIIIEQ